MCLDKLQKNVNQISILTKIKLYLALFSKITESLK